MKQGGGDYHDLEKERTNRMGRLVRNQENLS